jgi:hypothetical protein
MLLSWYMDGKKEGKTEDDIKEELFKWIHDNENDILNPLLSIDGIKISFIHVNQLDINMSNA